MSTTTIRVSTSLHRLLKKIAQTENESMQTILEKALERYRRENILEKTNQAFLVLRNNSDLWNEELQERASWDNTLEDDLKDNR